MPRVYQSGIAERPKSPDGLGSRAPKLFHRLPGSGIDAGPGEDFEERLNDYLHIQPETAVVDIPDIEGEFLLPGERVATIDLGPTGDAGSDLHASGLEGVIAGDVAHEEWTWSDDAVIAPATEGGGAGANDPKAIGHAWHRSNLEDAIAAIRAGRQPAVNGAEGRKAVELILALYQSAQNGGTPVELPLKVDSALKKLGVKR